jgi:hypothetical protein
LWLERDGCPNNSKYVYQLATAARFLGLITYEKDKLKSLSLLSENLKYLSRLTELQSEAEAAIRSPELRTSAAAAVRAKSLDASGLFQAKPEFFDPKLVEQMGFCEKEMDLTAALNCITTRAKEQSVSASKNEKESWIAPAPTFQIWSGVRELPFRLDRNLAFLTGDGKSKADSIWPMDFMLQVAFTSAPAFGASDARSMEYTDTKPFEFPQLHEGIRCRIAQEVNHPGYDPESASSSPLPPRPLRFEDACEGSESKPQHQLHRSRTTVLENRRQAAPRTPRAGHHVQHRHRLAKERARQKIHRIGVVRMV